jgi:hypothetical protein
MVGVDERWDHLKLVKAAGWAAPPRHSDIDPQHEAAMLVEHYREAARLDSVTQRGPEFVKLLGDAGDAAAELEQSLRAKPVAGEQAAKAFARSAATCTTCHAQFRDRPNSGN